MISTAASIPLTLCSVVIRRFIDSYTGRLPLAVAASTIPSASTVAIFSGAVFCLYHQLRRGTLVKIGMGRRISSMLNNSRHTIQRRMKNNSWFLRNLAACRRKCTEAMHRMARQSNDSLQNIQAETGIIVGTNSLPIFNHKSENCKNLKLASELPIENLYSNDSFDTHDCSIQDIRTENPKRNQLPSRKQKSYNVVTSRPVTRNSRKCIPEYTHEDGKNRLSSRKRKKPEVILNEPEEPISLSRPEVTRHIQRQLRRMSTDEAMAPPKILSRRLSERIKKQPKVQKITRKTRSGRVYAYRL